jgi:hypothetical protein
MYLLYKQQGWKLTDSANFVGMKAVITTASGTQGIGECKIDNKYYTCKELNSNALHLNDIVSVVETIEGVIIVEQLVTE